MMKEFLLKVKSGAHIFPQRIITTNMRATTPTRWSDHLEFELDKGDYHICKVYSSDWLAGNLPIARVRWADMGESSDGDVSDIYDDANWIQLREKIEKVNLTPDVSDASGELETDKDEAGPLLASEKPVFSRRQRARMRMRKGVR